MSIRIHVDRLLLERTSHRITSSLYRSWVSLQYDLSMSRKLRAEGREDMSTCHWQDLTLPLASNTLFAVIFIATQVLRYVIDGSPPTRPPYNHALDVPPSQQIKLWTDVVGL